jgi:ribonuclease P protein component
MNFSFGKEYKLCSHKQIESLFKEGKKVREFPFTLVFSATEMKIKHPFQVLISVSKRNFKRAHDRNYVKRCIREAFRKNKIELESRLSEQNQKIVFAIIYTFNERMDYVNLEQKLVKVLSKLTTQISNTNDKS